MYEAQIDLYDVKFNGSKFSSLEEAIDAADDEARGICQENAKRGDFTPVNWTIYDADGKIVKWAKTYIDIRR